MDGTSFTMRIFDEIREDKAYAELIENREKQIASSHATKRFFHRFSFVMLWHFRWLRYPPDNFMINKKYGTNFIS